jgi:hypothetical protein
VNAIDEEKELGPDWRAHRFPVQDALVSNVATMDSVEIPTLEQRYFPRPDGSFTRRAAYNGGPFDPTQFHIEVGGWDHTTCDACTRRIPPMSLCYITNELHFSELCPSCYATFVVSHLPFKRRVLWRLRKLWFNHAAA